MLITRDALAKEEYIYEGKIIKANCEVAVAFLFSKPS
jgi:hypothetical protein